MGSRYFYYLLSINALMNVILFVPRILYGHILEGAVMSMLLAVPIGTSLIFAAVWAAGKFPGQSVDEIMKPYVPSWYRNVTIWFLIFMWSWTAANTLTAFTRVVSRFINPDSPEVMILCLFLALVSLGALMASDTVLYALEVLLALSMPTILFFLYESLVNDSFKLDYVLDSLTELLHVPAFMDLGAATFVFTGYTNLVVFNRLFHKPMRLRFKWLIPVTGLLLLLVSYAVPIAFHGTISVIKYQYPWISTADSISLPYLFVERGVFVFLLIYIVISALSTVIHWHVALQLIGYAAGNASGDAGKRRTTRVSLLANAVFWGANIWMIVYLNEIELYQNSVFYMTVRLPAEMLLVFTLVYCAWRRISSEKR